MKGKHKFKLLHSVAARADDDESPDGGYLTAYEEVDIDDLFARKRQWSVEHVVPRSHAAGRGPHPAESDPVGWVEATQRANSRRSNYPLYLWPDPDGAIAPPNTLVRVDGEVHFVPPPGQRGRLARKWLFIRATYTDIAPPSAAQLRHAAEIVALAQHQRVWPAERRANQIYRAELGWANPLLEAGADAWYASAEWRALVFR